VTLSNITSGNRTRAIIVLQEAGRDPWNQFDPINQLANPATTHVIAPQFVMAADLDNHPTLAYWGGWRWGGLSDTNAPGARVSSYTVVDKMVDALIKMNRNLNTIVMVGHSAGAQFVHRYAVAGSLDGKRNYYGNPIKVRFIVANSSTYMYLDKRRVSDLNQGSTITKFIKNIYRGTCGGNWDDYGYGTTDPYNYLALHMPHFATYYTREVIYLIGMDDNVDCCEMDTSCSANIQGLNRRERAFNYFFHLYQHVNCPTYKWHNSKQKLIVLHECGTDSGNDCGHETAIVTATDCAKFYLFDSGSCTESPTVDIYTGPRTEYNANGYPK
jgi:hypothetical protein